MNEHWSKQYPLHEKDPFTVGQKPIIFDQNDANNEQLIIDYLQAYIKVVNEYGIQIAYQWNFDKIEFRFGGVYKDRVIFTEKLWKI